MQKNRLVLAASVATLTLAGCQYMPWHKDTSAELAAPTEAEKPVAVIVEEVVIVEKPAAEAAPVEETEACAVSDSRDWAAWIDRMPGPGATPTVHVSGKVDVNTGGYTFTWEEGPMDRSAIPALRLKLVPVKPDGMAMQVISTEEVHYSAPALSSGYSRVIIGCGGKTLAEITEITDAH